MQVQITLKGTAAKSFVVSFERDSKTYVEVYYRIFISALFREYFD